MTDKFTQIDTPQWMLDLFKSIDELDTSDDSGFRIFANDIVLQFGPKTVHGIEDCAEYAVGACARKFGIKVKGLKCKCI